MTCQDGYRDIYDDIKRSSYDIEIWVISKLTKKEWKTLGVQFQPKG